MTEQEAIKRIKEKHCTENQNCTDSCMHGAEHCAYSMAIKALEEIQQYRAIGTVKEIKIKEAQFARLSEGYLNDLSLLREYQAIGTIEELKALTEKSVAKKPLNDGMQRPFSYYCPNCKEELSDDGYEPDEEYCCNCGQHILIEN